MQIIFCLTFNFFINKDATIKLFWIMKKLVLMLLLHANAVFAFFVFEEPKVRISYNLQSGKDYYYLPIPAKDVKKNEIKAFTQSGVMFIEVKSPQFVYSQTFTLPPDADEKSIEGVLNDDILTFKIKKINDKNIIRNEIKIK